MTGNMHDTIAQDVARHADRVAQEANEYEAPKPPQDAHIDEVPALDGVIDAQTEDQAGDGVDASSMPAFRDMRRLLPSKRFEKQAEMMALVADMPKEWQDGDVTEGSVDLASMDFGKLSTLITKAEGFVLDLAEDRTAMEEWLIDQENGMQAVMDAFTKATGLLGN